MTLFDGHLPPHTRKELNAWTPYVHNRRRITVLAVFTVFAFLLLSYRSQHQTNDIRRESNLECVARARNIEHTNATWNALAALERSNTTSSPEVTARRLAVYEQAKLEPVPCR